MPRTREPHLFVMSVGSICWIVATVSVAIPPVAAFLLGFLPLPERLDALIAWYVMLAFLIVIPPLVTVAILRALPPDDRPHGPTAIIRAAGGSLRAARRVITLKNRRTPAAGRGPSRYA